MARREEKGPQLIVTETGEQAVVTQTVIEERPGETHIHRTVREWHQHTPEKLREIEAIIDSWGRRSAGAAPARQLDHGHVGAQVDKLTRRVKASRKVVVQERVTEWVDRPAEGDAGGAVATRKPVRRRSRPKRRARTLKSVPKKKAVRKAKKAAKPNKVKAKLTSSDPAYKPQCSALTADGQQCRNSTRGVSRYCAPHKGYQPPTAKGLAKRIEGDSWDADDKLTDRKSIASSDTRPVVRKAKDTRVKVRKAPKRKTAKATKSAKKTKAKKGKKKGARSKR